MEAAPVVGFDGSDLVPTAAGTGTFWAGMRSFFGGGAVSSVITEIDAGWSDSTGGG